MIGVFCRGSSPTLSGCRISGNSGGGVVCLDGSSPSLTGCTISGNSGDGLLCGRDSSPTLTDSRISGNTGGGVVCVGNSSPILSGCTISGNQGGGVSCDDSSPILMGCTISGNLGVGLDLKDSSPTATDCVISGNSGRGLVCGRSSSPILTASTISGNTGGGASFSNASSAVLTNCIVWGHAGGSIEASPESNAGLFYSCIEGDRVWPGEGNINADPLFCGWDQEEVVARDQTEFEAALSFSLVLSPDSPCLGAGEAGANMGADTGVCDAPGGEARLIRLAPGTYGLAMSLDHNVSIRGAGVDQTVIEGSVFGLRTGASLSDLTITTGGVFVTSGEAPEILNCAITGTSGVSCEASSPTLRGCSISGNSGDGVACRAASSPTLVGCTISGNTSSGVFATESSRPTLTGCTISGNSSRGLLCVRSSATVTNCTISGNGNSAVFCITSSPTVTNCTISGNAGDGVHCERGSSPTLTNLIVWQNDGRSIEADQRSNPQVTFSLIGQQGWPGEGNLDQDPLFVSPGVFDFDRRTQEGLPDFLVDPGDYHLRPGSPAIDAGTAHDAPAADIEGNGRACGAGVDMGAYESGNCDTPKRFLRGDCDGDGRVRGIVTDAIFLLRYTFVGGAPPPCLAACDADGDGRVAGQITDVVYILNFNFRSGPAPVAPFPECGSGRLPTDEALGCETPPEACE